MFSGKRVGAKNKQTKTNKNPVHSMVCSKNHQHFAVVLALTQFGEKPVHKTVEWYSFSSATKNGWRAYITELMARRTEAY